MSLSNIGVFKHLLAFDNDLLVIGLIGYVCNVDDISAIGHKPLDDKILIARNGYVEIVYFSDETAQNL